MDDWFGLAIYATCKKMTPGGWCLDHVSPKPRRYLPFYLNYALEDGTESIRDHLRRKHRLRKDAVKALTVDQCFRKHDELHTRKRQRIVDHVLNKK